MPVKFPKKDFFCPLNSQKGKFYNFFPTWEFKKYFSVPLFSRGWDIQQWEKRFKYFPKKGNFFTQQIPKYGKFSNIFPTSEFREYFYVPLFSPVWENSPKNPNQDILPIFSPCLYRHWEKRFQYFPKKGFFPPLNSQKWEIFQLFPNMGISKNLLCRL